jgi:hypothetical protein
MGTQFSFDIRVYSYNCLSVTYDSSVVFCGSPVSSTNKTDRHDITEILLKATFIELFVLQCSAPDYKRLWYLQTFDVLINRKLKGTEVSIYCIVKIIFILFILQYLAVSTPLVVPVVLLLLRALWQFKYHDNLWSYSCDRYHDWTSNLINIFINSLYILLLM